MTVLEVKKLLLEKGLNISDMSRTLIDENLIETKNFDSVRTMLTNLLHGHSFYPSLAAVINRRFKLKIKRPAHLKTVRQAIKEVA